MPFKFNPCQPCCCCPLPCGYETWTGGRVLSDSFFFTSGLFGTNAALPVSESGSLVLGSAQGCPAFWRSGAPVHSLEQFTLSAKNVSAGTYFWDYRRVSDWQTYPVPAGFNGIPGTRQMPVLKSNTLARQLFPADTVSLSAAVAEFDWKFCSSVQARPRLLSFPDNVPGAWAGPWTDCAGVKTTVFDLPGHARFDAGVFSGEVMTYDAPYLPTGDTYEFKAIFTPDCGFYSPGRPAVFTQAPTASMRLPGCSADVPLGFTRVSLALAFDLWAEDAPFVAPWFLGPAPGRNFTAYGAGVYCSNLPDGKKSVLVFLNDGVESSDLSRSAPIIRGHVQLTLDPTTNDVSVSAVVRVRHPHFLAYNYDNVPFVDVVLFGQDSASYSCADQSFNIPLTLPSLAGNSVPTDAGLLTIQV